VPWHVSGLNFSRRTIISTYQEVPIDSVWTTMALPRTCSSLGRSLLSRNISRVARPAFVNSRASIAVPFRQFASSSWRFEEAVKPAVATPESVQPEHVVSEEQRSRNARTVFLRYFPRLITPSHVRRLFEAEGLEMYVFLLCVPMHVYVTCNYC
jgi:hypothetical protein